MNLVKKLLFLLLIVFLFSSLTKNFFDYKKNLRFHQQFKEEYEKEKKKNITLKTQILKKTDPAEIEKTIRNKLNLLRPNEIAILLPPPTSTPTPLITPFLPIYQQWWSLFFGKNH